jgi:hypothetical protein
LKLNGTVSTSKKPDMMQGRRLKIKNYLEMLRDKGKLSLTNHPSYATLGESLHDERSQEREPSIELQGGTVAIKGEPKHIRIESNPTQHHFMEVGKVCKDNTSQGVSTINANTHANISKRETVLRSQRSRIGARAAIPAGESALVDMGAS